MDNHRHSAFLSALPFLHTVAELGGFPERWKEGKREREQRAKGKRGKDVVELHEAC